jgi:tRNA(Ile2) C34 agmatinyltransferase TiaS
METPDFIPCPMCGDFLEFNGRLFECPSCATLYDDDDLKDWRELMDADDEVDEDDFMGEEEIIF